MRNSKKIIRTVFFVLAAAGIFLALDFVLYPCTYVRNDIHAVLSEEHEDVFLGTSHGKMGIDPDVVSLETGRSAHNLCVGGEYMADTYYLAKLLMEKNPPSRIIYELNPSYFMEEKEEGNNFLLFYHEFPFSLTKLQYLLDVVSACDFRSLLFPWYEYSLSYELGKMKDTVYQKWNQNYDVSYLAGSAQEYHENGYIERYPVSREEKQPTTARMFDSDRCIPENMEYLDKLIALCREKNVELLVITTPIPLATLKEYESSFVQAWEYFGEYFSEKGIPYYNFNQEYYRAFTHDISAFTDYDGHMHGAAAGDFSTVLGKLLAS